MKKNPPESTPATHGGKRPNAGRKKGVGNKLTEKLKAAALAKANLTPLEFMLDLMTQPVPEREPGEDAVVFLARVQAWREERFEAAKAALPFCHPKLANIEHSGPEGGAIPHRIAIEFVSVQG